MHLHICQQQHIHHQHFSNKASLAPRRVAVPGRATPPTTSAAAPPLAEGVVALDVEYAHFVVPGRGEVSAPAWLALVDHHCQLLLKTHVQPQVSPEASWFGGVGPAHFGTAPSLAVVQQQLQALLQDKRLLLGHGLAKDLAALGLHHPTQACFDTMTHPAFCNKAGNARSLRVLALQHLGRAIQQQQQPRRGGGHAAAWRQGQQLQRQQQQQQAQQQQQGGVAVPARAHDPEEDAAAVMQLYQQVVFPATYEGQVAAATAQLLAAVQQRQRQQQQQADEHD